MQEYVGAGIVLMRLAGLPNVVRAEVVANVFQERKPELPGAFSVISPGVVRIRKTGATDDAISASAPASDR